MLVPWHGVVNKWDKEVGKRLNILFVNGQCFFKEWTVLGLRGGVRFFLFFLCRSGYWELMSPNVFFLLQKKFGQLH